MNRDRFQIIAIAIIAIILVIVAAVYTYLHQSFTSPVAITFASPVYLPFVVRKYRTLPDQRFGIAEHNLEQMLILGFPDDGRYHSVQHTKPEATDTVRFLRPAQRDPAGTWLLGTYDTVAGRWVHEADFRQFVHSHDGMYYVVGNELMLGTPIGDSHVTPSQYAQWYRAAWELIKSENPTAQVGPFGPMTWSPKLLPVWSAYLDLTGELMPVDFYPVHRYMWPGQTPDFFWQELVDWIDWLESHRGRAWSGPRNYWLAEFGLPEWKYPDWVTPELALEFMADVVPRLKENDLGITTWVWWYSGQDTALIHGRTPTELGKLYLKLAMEP